MQSLRKEVEEYFASFGVPKSAFAGKEFVKISNSIWLVTKGLKKPQEFNVQTYGLRIMHVVKWGLKPTSFALQLLAKHINKRICEVDGKELLGLIEGKPLARKMERGYVALKFRGKIIGCALSTGEKIYSQLPKLLMQSFKELLQ